MIIKGIQKMEEVNLSGIEIIDEINKIKDDTKNITNKTMKLINKIATFNIKHLIPIQTKLSINELNTIKSFIYMMKDINLLSNQIKNDLEDISNLTNKSKNLNLYNKLNDYYNLIAQSFNKIFNEDYIKIMHSLINDFVDINSYKDETIKEIELITTEINNLKIKISLIKDKINNYNVRVKKYRKNGYLPNVKIQNNLSKNNNLSNFIKMNNVTNCK